MIVILLIFFVISFIYWFLGMAVANGGFLTDEIEVMDRRALVENEWNQGRAPEQRAETSHSLFEEDDIRNSK